MATSVIKIKVKAGQAAAFESVIRSLVAACNANEPGIRFYQGFRGDNPLEYWMIESFETPEAQKAHTASEHFKALRPALGDCMDGPPEVLRLADFAPAAAATPA